MEPDVRYTYIGAALIALVARAGHRQRNAVAEPVQYASALALVGNIACQHARVGGDFL